MFRLITNTPLLSLTILFTQISTFLITEIAKRYLKFRNRLKNHANPHDENLQSIYFHTRKP